MKVPSEVVGGGTPRGVVRQGGSWVGGAMVCCRKEMMMLRWTGNQRLEAEDHLVGAGCAPVGLEQEKIPEEAELRCCCCSCQRWRRRRSWNRSAGKRREDLGPPGALSPGARGRGTEFVSGSPLLQQHHHHRPCCCCSSLQDGCTHSRSGMDFCCCCGDYWLTPPPHHGTARSVSRRRGPQPSGVPGD